MNKKNRRWPKKYQAVVSLTYDDGVENHISVVAPLLERYRLRGTFYTPLKSNLMANPLVWRGLAEKGHEIGNHTVFHPCWSIGGKYSTWLPEKYNLENYNSDQWIHEVKTANRALWLIDGKHDRTFGNTCWDNYLGPEEKPTCLEPFIEDIFLAARGEATNRPVNLASINFNNLGTIPADRRSFRDFTPELDEILDTGGWIIYTMHGVGIGSHNHIIEEYEHLQLVQYLHDHSKQIWTAPVINVVQYLKKNLS